MDRRSARYAHERFISHIMSDKTGDTARRVYGYPNEMDDPKETRARLKETCARLRREKWERDKADALHARPARPPFGYNDGRVRRRSRLTL
jgi:hypothetical protein